MALHAVTANVAVAVAEHHRHYIGSSQLHALTAFTSRERDPDTHCLWDCVGLRTAGGLVIGSCLQVRVLQAHRDKWEGVLREWK